MKQNCLKLFVKEICFHFDFVDFIQNPFLTSPNIEKSFSFLGYIKKTT